MADVLTFNVTPRPTHYSVDVTLHPDNIMFTVNDVNADAKSLLKVADELEKIARIIRTDVVVGIV